MNRLVSLVVKAADSKSVIVGSIPTRGTKWRFKMFKAQGKLVYDPVRPDFKKTHKTRTLIVELPRDQLDQYYQWFLEKKFGQWMTLQRPMFGLHCTVVKGDERISQDRMKFWKKYQGHRVELMYDPTRIERHWQFWSLTVEAPQLIDIRRELGLRLDFRLHITFGRQYDWQPKLVLPEQRAVDVDFRDDFDWSKV